MKIRVRMRIWGRWLSFTIHTHMHPSASSVLLDWPLRYRLDFCSDFMILLIESVVLFQKSSWCRCSCLVSQVFPRTNDTFSFIIDLLHFDIKLTHTLNWMQLQILSSHGSRMSTWIAYSRPLLFFYAPSIIVISFCFMFILPVSYFWRARIDR